MDRKVAQPGSDTARLGLELPLIGLVRRKAVPILQAVGLIDPFSFPCHIRRVAGCLHWFVRVPCRTGAIRGGIVRVFRFLLGWSLRIFGGHGYGYLAVYSAGTIRRCLSCRAQVKPA